MASKTVFASARGPVATAVNEAGGKAYAMSDEAALTQYVMTGTFNGTFYATAEAQLDKVLELAAKVPATTVAKLAVWARREGYMKDAPALLLATLASRDKELFKAAFPEVVDNVKMLRNVVQIIRSGTTGRKSLGTMPKTAVADWLLKRDPEALFRQSIGTSPSLADVVKMVHPKPKTDAQRAFFGWLLEKEHKADHLPEIVRAYDAFRKEPTGEPPPVPFEMLTSLPLSEDQWRTIARRASWTQLRMSLNTFQRHGVFNDSATILSLAKRLEDPDLVRAAKVFPYQLFAAYQNATDIPMPMRIALQKAMEIAIENVPAVDGEGVYVCPDVSGSMDSPVTGTRVGSTSKVTCRMVAALVAAAVVRKNPLACVLPFHNDVVTGFHLNPLDSVMTNASALATLPSGGTNCSAPLWWIAEKAGGKASLVIMVSDNESWADGPYGGRSTASVQAWREIRKRSPNAKLVLLDVQPYATTQVPEGEGVLLVGGFSDAVFEVIAGFASGGRERLTDAVSRVSLGSGSNA